MYPCPSHLQPLELSIRVIELLSLSIVILFGEFMPPGQAIKIGYFHPLEVPITVSRALPLTLIDSVILNFPHQAIHLYP